MENLAKIRDEKGLSQGALSGRIGIAQGTVSVYESGKAFPKVEKLIKLCDFFHVSSDYLLDRTDIRTPVNDLLIDNLNPQELELVSLFRRLPILKKELALGMLMGLVK